MTGSPSREAVGFETDADRSVRENAEAALQALEDHVETLTRETAQDFVWKAVAGAGPEHADVVLDDPETDIEAGIDANAALFMGGEETPYAGDDTGLDTSPDTRHTEPTPAGTSAPDDGTALPTGALPTGQLDALTPDERRRHARKRGCSWADTDDARDRLEETIFEIVREEDHRVVDAPTSLGKTHTVAATRWGARDDVTGGRPVVHLLETRDARDEAAAVAREHGGQHIVLKARHEACPVAAGDYDPENVGDDEDREPVTIDGQAASKYIKELCGGEKTAGRGIHFGAAHRHLEAHNDQDRDLPCSEGAKKCEAIAQWDRLRDGPDDGEYWPLIIGTHNFGYVPSLRMNTNVVIDEGPDYRQEDLTTDRVRGAVSAFLDAVDCPIRTYEGLVHAGRHGLNANEHREPVEYEDVEAALTETPGRDWYFEHPDAHALAPALARAIFHAEDRANGRRVGKTHYEPPRLDADARDADDWNKEWVTVVLDGANDIQTVRTTPDFGAARSLVGLDAHPALPKWQVNTVPWIQDRPVLDPEERRLWRRYDRGLRVVQVGDATRPLTSGEYFDRLGAEAIIEQLRGEYGEDFRTALTAKSVADELEAILAEYADDPETMHYGEEKSRNDFAGEPVGFVNGCIDPGDDHVLDLLAELDLDAAPERSDPEECDRPEHAECDTCDGDGCRECLGTGLKRKQGREFVGDDARTAQAILASVRENHVAQAAGRYARDPDDPDATATVFVRTDAMPPGFADVQAPGVAWTYSEKQDRVVETLREADTRLSARDVARRADVSKRHARRTLNQLAEDDVVHAHEGAGEQGATLYAEDGTPTTGVADLSGGGARSGQGTYGGVSTWSVRTSDPTSARGGDKDVTTDPTTATPDGTAALSSFNGGDSALHDAD
jgi:hypothetical protein